MMEEPKQAIYAILSTLEGVDVNYEQPEVISKIDQMPVVTYTVSENLPFYTLESDIGYQKITVRVHFWGKDTKATGSTLLLAEEIMRESGYLMSGGAIDVPEPEGYSHLVATFVY